MECSEIVTSFANTGQYLNVRKTPLEIISNAEDFCVGHLLNWTDRASWPCLDANSGQLLLFFNLFFFAPTAQILMYRINLVWENLLTWLQTKAKAKDKSKRPKQKTKAKDKSKRQKQKTKTKTKAKAVQNPFFTSFCDANFLEELGAKNNILYYSCLKIITIYANRNSGTWIFDSNGIHSFAMYHFKKPNCHFVILPFCFKLF